MDESLVANEVVAQVHTELPEPLREPTRPKNPLFLMLYAVANMVFGVATITISTILLPAQIATLATNNRTSIFSLILGVGAVASVLTNPLAGMLSDRTTSRLGRRRLWIIAGGVLTVVDLLLLSIARSLLVVIIEWIILQIAINMIAVAHAAILPDQIPIRQRATVAAFATGLGLQLGGLVGQTLVARFFTGIQAAYTSLAITIALILTLFLLVLRETPLPREQVAPFDIKKVFAAYWLNPITHPDFARTWLSRCFIFLGYTTAVHFMFYFLQDSVQHAKLFPGQTIAQGVQTVFAINVASIIVTSLLGGMLSDKMQRRKPFVIASSLTMMAGLSLYAFFPIWSMVIGATVVFAIGFGVFAAVDLALASQVLPAARDRGKDIGIVNTAVFVPTILSPVVAGITLGFLHSYLALFLVLAMAALFAAVLIMPIKTVR